MGLAAWTARPYPLRVSDEVSAPQPTGLLRRLHQWIAIPKLDLTEEQFELYAVTNWAMAIGLVSHLMFIPLFWVLEAPTLSLVNVGSVLCFVVAITLSRRAKLLGALILGVAEVGVHAWVATYFYGLETLFHIHMLLGLELLVLFAYVSLKARVAFGAVISVTYIGLMVAAYGIEPVQTVSPTLGIGLAVFNALIFTAVTTGMLAYFTWTVQVNRRARDEARSHLEEKNARLAESELALSAARDLAEEGSRSKSMFLANMSHELRTPLNAIIGYSEMLAEDAEDEGNAELAEEVGKIQGAGRHLLSLINGILDLSKIEAGRMEIERIDFDLPRIIRETLDTARPLIERGENALELQPDAATPEHAALGTMHSDPTKVRQILFNLLSNAAKFTQNGTIRVHVTRAPHPNDDPDRITIAVEDTGIGMEPDVAARIFDEFAQADDSTTRKYGGTGLGLAIAKRFAEMLGGGIEVSSEPGKGSRFVVWLAAEAPRPTRTGVFGAGA